MRKLVILTMFATLPLAAGFALCGNALAQDDMTAVAPSYASAPPSPVYAPVQTAPVVMQTPNSPSTVAAAGGLETRLSSLEQQLRDLTNQVEQKDFQIRQLQESLDGANARIQSLEARGPGATGYTAPVSPAANSFDTPASDASVAPTPTSATPPQPTAPKQQQIPAGPLTSNSSANNPIPGQLTDPNGAYQPTTTPPLGQIDEGAPAATDGTVTSGRGTPAAGNAAQAYDQAFGFLQQSNYADAENAFRNFLTTYPTHPLAANAQYWLGETYFAQTQYSLAAKTFAKAFQDYPKGQKAPDALLKLSMTLDKMGKKDDACLTLKELTKRFSSGPASVLRRGQEESARMACPA